MKATYHTFKNNEGDEIQLRGDLTIEDLTRMGWSDFRLVKPDEPMKGGDWRCEVDEITVEDVAVGVPKGFKTFNEWDAKNRSIIKGEKATWLNGVAYFSKAQTQKKRDRRENWYGEDVWDDWEIDHCDWGDRGPW